MAKTYLYTFEDGKTLIHDTAPTLEDLDSIDQGLLFVIAVEGTICGIDHTGKQYDLPRCKVDNYTSPVDGEVVEFHTP